MIIYSKNNTVILDVPVDDTSYRYRAIRQGDKVFLYFSLTEHVEIPVHSYIDFQGQRYTLWKPENVTKHGERNLEYDVELGGQWELLNRTKYKFLSGKPHKLKFPLTAKPRMFMQLLVDNLNLHDSGWTLGSCIDAPEKALAFSHENCMEVINRLADEYNTEFELIGKTINFGKVERCKDDPLPLSYGKGNGFKIGVGRQSQGDKAPVTILYVQGGERNIDQSAYKSPTLLLPKSQELEYQGRRYKTDADGMYITRADRELVEHNEDGYDASNIYPSRVGTVSEVIVVDKDKNFYDIKDNSIPAALDYSKCRIAGEKATIIFQTGILTGKEFDLEQTDKELTGYIHTERRFKIVPQEVDGQVMPNDTFKPAVNDQYAIFHISLPAAYVCDNTTKTGASWEMFREAVRYMYENEEEAFTFTGELDGMWAKKKWLEIGGKLQPGSYIQFSDTQFQPAGIAIRITGIKDYINKPHSPELELSNTPVAGFLSSDLGKLEGDEVKDEERHNNALSFTKRRWRDAVEALSMLEAAIAGFSASINPITIQTMAMLVGDESLQFRFVNSKTSPSEVIPDFKYNQSAKVFTVPATILQHMTLGIDKLSSSHTANEYKCWNMSAYTSPPLDVTDAMYLYSKCSKSGTTGSFLLSKTPYKMDPGDGYYYFLTGALSSEFESERSFVTVYGFTEILPGRITVGMIVSPDGQTYFNVAQGEIGGKIVFKAGSSGLDNVAEWPAAKQDITNAKNSANQANQSVAGLGNYVDGAFADGIIEESEAKAIEKYINTVNNSKASVEATYNKLYVNPYLTGSAKSGLLNAKVTLFGAIDNLLSAINSAIYDGRTTQSEKNNVDSKFSYFNSAMASFYTAVETANRAIQDSINSATAAKDDIAKKIGYTSYADMEAKALAGVTVITGGKINTSLVDAVAIVTKALAAEMITTGNLTVTTGAKIADFRVKEGQLKYVGTDFSNTAKVYMGDVESGNPDSGNARITAFGVKQNSYIAGSSVLTTDINNLIIDNKTSGNKKTTLVIKTAGGAKSTAIAAYGNVTVNGNVTGMGIPLMSMPSSNSGYDHNCSILGAGSVTLPTGEDMKDWFGTGSNWWTNYGTGASGGVDAQDYDLYICAAYWNTANTRVNGNPGGNADYSGVSGTPLYGIGVVRSGYGYVELKPGQCAHFKKVRRAWYCLGVG